MDSRTALVTGASRGIGRGIAIALGAATASAFEADGVVSVALHPGLVRTEGVMQFAEHLDLTASQSPQGVGRVVAALAADENLMSHNGRALLVDDLAARYRVDVTT